MSGQPVDGLDHSASRLPAAGHSHVPCAGRSQAPDCPIMRVAILGASTRRDRYAYLAWNDLRAHGHEPIGVNPALPELPQTLVVPTVADLPPGVHTLTVYVSPARSQGLAPAIIAAGIQRVIFNPGSENEALAADLRAGGVRVQEACTLVLLRTAHFED